MSNNIAHLKSGALYSIPSAICTKCNTSIFELKSIEYKTLGTDLYNFKCSTKYCNRIVSAEVAWCYNVATSVERLHKHGIHYLPFSSCIITIKKTEWVP